MKDVFELLTLVTEKWPPLEGFRHVVYLDRGVLTLYINSPTGGIPVRFDGPADLDLTPAEIVGVIATLTKEVEKITNGVKIVENESG